MHGKKDDAGGEGLAVLDLRSQIVEGRDVNPAQAKPLGGKMENRAPEFFSGVGQSRNHERPRTKRADGLGVLIKACTGHEAIVVCEGWKLQTDLVCFSNSNPHVVIQSEAKGLFVPRSGTIITIIMRRYRSPSLFAAFKSIPTCSAFL